MKNIIIIILLFIFISCSCNPDPVETTCNKDSDCKTTEKCNLTSNICESNFDCTTCKDDEICNPEERKCDIDNRWTYQSEKFDEV